MYNILFIYMTVNLDKQNGKKQNALKSIQLLQIFYIIKLLINKLFQSPVIPIL